MGDLRSQLKALFYQDVNEQFEGYTQRNVTKWQM